MEEKEWCSALSPFSMLMDIYILRTQGLSRVYAFGRFQHRAIQFGGRVLWVQCARHQVPTRRSYQEHSDQNKHTMAQWEGDRDEPGGNRGPLQNTSRSFKDALIGSESHTAEEWSRRSIKFSYVEASTKAWLDCSLVGKLRRKLDI